MDSRSRKSDEELLEELNEGLTEVKEDGTYAKIYEKWFHTAAPKEISKSATHEGA